MDELSAKGRVETLIRSLSRFSEQAMLIITGKSDVALQAKKMGVIPFCGKVFFGGKPGS